MSRRLTRAGRFSFSRGALRVRLPDRELVVRAWPSLEARERRALDRSWRAFTPAFRLLRRGAGAPRARKTPRPLVGAQLDLPLATARAQSAREERRAALLAFREAMPREVARAVAPFGHEQWRLLRLVLANRDALDLIRDNPGLAFCLALSHRFVGSHSRSGGALAARWIGARQQEILAWLRFPPTRAVARILARIQAPALSAESALQLLITLRDERARRLLGHMETINAGALELVHQPGLRPLVTPSLLAAVARDRRERDHAHCAEHLAGALAMADELGRDLSRRRFRDPARIVALHDELASAYAREHEGELLRCRFGRPPFPGTPNLVPLTTPRQLIEEGRIMRNCVAGFAPRVEKRRAYVYRVMRPERATLALTRSPSGGWSVGELYRAGNVAVARTTREAIEAWLASHTLS